MLNSNADLRSIGSKVAENSLARVGTGLVCQSDGDEPATPKELAPIQLVDKNDEIGVSLFFTKATTEFLHRLLLGHLTCLAKHYSSFGIEGRER